MINLGTKLSASLEPQAGTVDIDFEVLLDQTLITGATGAGKTTLATSLLEQVRSAGVPVLVLDTAGDISSHLQERTGAPILPGFTDDPSPIAPTVQLNEVRALDLSTVFHMPASGHSGSEAWMEEAEALVRLILELLGFRSRGATPEATLLEHIVLKAWSDGRNLHLDELTRQIVHPPFRTLGVFDVDIAVPPTRRRELAGSVQALLPATNPGPEAGVTIDLGALLSQPSGEPAINVITFRPTGVVLRRVLAGVILAKLATYVRDMPDSNLVVLLDEAGVFIPAGVESPTVRVVSRMLSTWPAHGAALILVAQQPEEVGQFARDACETWIVGRTPATAARHAVVEELDLLTPPVNEEELDQALRHMAFGQFVLRSIRHDRLHYFELPPEVAAQG